MANSVSYKSKPAKTSSLRAASGAVSRPQRKPLRSSSTLYNKLDSYQKRGVEFALAVETAALLFEQGTGKTWIAGGIIERLMSPEFAGLLVVSLQNLESTWVKFFKSHLPGLVICRDWDTFKVAPFPKLLLMHYEAIRKKGLVEKIRRRPLTFIGYDESQRLKNRTTVDSRTAAKLRACGEYRVILTGTPMDENPAELWGQFRFLREDVFGTVWSEFEDEFFEPLDDKVMALKEKLGTVKPGSARWRRLLNIVGRAMGKREFDFDRLEDLIDLVGPYSMRVTKSVLNLPPMKLHRVPIPMWGEQRQIYDDVARHMVSHLGRSRITTPMRVTQLGRLHQICGGYVPDDDGNVHEVGRAKMRRLLSLVEAKRKPIVIFAKYLTEIAEIEAELIDAGYAVRVINGKTKKKDRPAIIDQFQRGKLDVLVAQERTGGVGIDLFRSSLAIFYSMTYSRVDFEQALARLHRRGQEFAVDVYLLFIAGTVDEDVYEAILNKDRVTRKVLVELEQRRQHRGYQGRRQVRQKQQGSPASGRRRRVQVHR